MTFWGHLNEDASLLEDAGYAVVNFTPFGGGEITADGDPDFLGLRGPLDVPATRVVLRACALPDAFSPITGSSKLSAASVANCKNGQDALDQASGVDLSLMIDTGVGPLVLSASAWTRVVAAAVKAGLTPPLPPVPPTPAGSSLPPLYVATWYKPIDVLLWATIPRFVLINLEAGTDNDPGPCVELGRSRRTEIVAYQNQMVTDPAPGLCGAPCDVDPNNTGEAANSAAYLEIGGQIPVAVISDDDPFLQGLRFDVLPEGPELDGLVGANALGRSRLELDYLSSPSRAVFSCETDDRRSLLGGGPLPAAPGQIVDALLLRPWAARVAGQLFPGRRRSGDRRLGRRCGGDRRRRDDGCRDGHPITASGSSRSVGLPTEVRCRRGCASFPPSRWA